MGFFSGIKKVVSGVFGGSKTSQTSQQQNTVQNTNNIDIHFDELAKVEEEKLSHDISVFEWVQKLTDYQLTQEQKEKQKNEKIKLLELSQNQEALEQGKKNTNITIFFAVAGLLLTMWQIFKKGKK